MIVYYIDAGLSSSHATASGSTLALATVTTATSWKSKLHEYFVREHKGKAIIIILQSSMKQRSILVVASSQELPVEILAMLTVLDAVKQLQNTMAAYKVVKKLTNS